MILLMRFKVIRPCLWPDWEVRRHRVYRARVVLVVLVVRAVWAAMVARVRPETQRIQRQLGRRVLRAYQEVLEALVFV